MPVDIYMQHEKYLPFPGKSMYVSQKQNKSKSIYSKLNSICYENLLFIHSESAL